MLFPFSSLLFLLFTLAFASVSVAWIVLNRSTDQNALSITSESVDMPIVGYNVYQCEWNPETETSTYRDATNSAFSLNPYDAIFAQNHNTPAFIRVQMQGSTVSEGTVFNVYLARSTVNDDTSVDNENGLWTLDAAGRTVVDNQLSNIVGISVATIPSLHGSAICRPSMIRPPPGRSGPA